MPITTQGLVNARGTPDDIFKFTNLLYALDGQIFTPLAFVAGLEDKINEVKKNKYYHGNEYDIVDTHPVGLKGNKVKDSDIGEWNPSNKYGDGVMGFLQASIQFATRISKAYSAGHIAKVIAEQGALYAMNPLPGQVINPGFPFLGPLAQPDIAGNTLDTLPPFSRDYESATGLDRLPNDEPRGEGNLIDQAPDRDQAGSSYLDAITFQRRRSPVEIIENKASFGLLAKLQNVFKRPTFINSTDEQFSDVQSSTTTPIGLGPYPNSYQAFTKQTHDLIAKKSGYTSNRKASLYLGERTRDHNSVSSLDKFYDDPSWETSDHTDYMPFFVTDLRKPDGKNKIYLRAFISSLTETYNSDWERVEIYGRPESFAHWKNCDRKFNIALDCPAFNPHELTSIYKKLNFLAQLNYAEFKNGRPYQPPICRIRLGDLIKRTINGSPIQGDSVLVGLAGYIDGLNIDYTSKSNVWEITEGSKVPKIFTISFGFNVLHDVSVDSNVNFYDVDGIGSNFNVIFHPVGVI